jgi:prepilin-type N-terminal cleavage/methylation domain-containing protein
MVHPTAGPGARRPERRGFTVVEVLVALIVVAVGLLGVAGTAAIALRSSSAATREQLAVSRARTRLALLESAGCSRAASGERLHHAGLLDRWIVGPLTNRVRLVHVSADWDDTGRRRTLTLRSALLC